MQRIRVCWVNCMAKFAILALGGTIGTILRYLVQGLFQAQSAVFPWGTFAVNAIGSFVIGFLWAFFEHGTINPNMRLFLFIGLLGGFTTFSSYSLETMNLVRDGEKSLALLNVVICNTLPLFLVFGGLFTARFLINLAK
jgi:fluoride exporter